MKQAFPFNIGTVHIIGIGGIGMSGYAEVLHNLGYKVQGSDQSENANVLRLRETAEVECVHEWRGIAVGVRRRGEVLPLRPIRLVPRLKVLRHRRHLVGEVVHSDDLRAGLLGGRVNLRLF